MAADGWAVVQCPAEERKRTVPNSEKKNKLKGSKEVVAISYFLLYFYSFLS
jgi:hypothetical protein